MEITEEQLRGYASEEWPAYNWKDAEVRVSAFHTVLILPDGPVLRITFGNRFYERANRETKTLQTLARAELPVPIPQVLAGPVNSQHCSATLMTRVPGTSIGDADDTGSAGYRIHEYVPLLDAFGKVSSSGLCSLPAPRTWCGGAEWPVVVETELGPLLNPQARYSAMERVSDLQRIEDITAAVVCHGDFGPHSILWNRHRPVGLIDLDHACVGDPAIDVAPLIGFHGAGSIEPIVTPDLLRRAMFHRATLSLQVAAAAHLNGASNLRDHALHNFSSRNDQGTLRSPRGNSATDLEDPSDSRTLGVRRGQACAGAAMAPTPEVYGRDRLVQRAAAPLRVSSCPSAIREISVWTDISSWQRKPGTLIVEDRLPGWPSSSASSQRESLSVLGTMLFASAGSTVRDMHSMSRPPVADMVLGLCGLAVVGIEASLVSDYGLSWFVLANASLQLGLSAALIVRRVWRRTSFVASYGLLAALAIVLWVAPVNLGVTPMALCAPLSLYVVARYERTAWGVVGLLLGIVGAFVNPFRWAPSPSNWSIPAIVIAMVGTYLWATGRRRTELAYQDRLAIEREQHSRVTAARVAQAQADERARLARELHDIVAHSLTVVQVQAGTGLAVGTTAQMQEALTNVRDSSGHALAEVRSLVGALRDQEATTTNVSGDLTTIPSLCAAAREAGVTLRAQVPDQATLTQWQESWPAQPRLTLLRVVQEALTNVIKHGGPHPQAQLTVCSRDGDVVVDVWNDSAGDVSDAGFGLVGLRERVLLAGGALQAGPDSDGFRVRATIPTAIPAGGEQP